MPCLWKPGSAYWVKSSGSVTGFVLAERSHQTGCSRLTYETCSEAMIHPYCNPSAPPAQVSADVSRTSQISRAHVLISGHCKKLSCGKPELPEHFIEKYLPLKGRHWKERQGRIPRSEVTSPPLRLFPSDLEAQKEHLPTCDFC